MNTLAASPNIFEKKSIRLSLIALMIALLSACGSNVTPRATSNASGSGPSTDTSSLDVVGDGQAQCNSFDSTSVRLGGKVTTYYYNRVIQEDKVRVRITSLVEAFDSNANYYIQAFRWRVLASGATDIDTTPVQFQFENGTGSVSPISSLTTSVSAKSITAIRSSKGITGTGAVDFFSKTTMVVNAVDYNWQALKFVVYDGSTSPATVVGQSDFLLPVFQANPSRYAASHHATLVALHPFVAQSGQTATEKSWADRSLSFCF